jgi:hypothetical protein
MEFRLKEESMATTLLRPHFTVMNLTSVATSVRLPLT